MKIFSLPDLGEGLAEAEIVRWHVKPGDRINADDPMLAVETAKAIVEVPSPFSGVVKTLHGDPGDAVAAGGLLVEFEPDSLLAAAATLVASIPTENDDFAFSHGSNTQVSANTTPSGNTRIGPLTPSDTTSDGSPTSHSVSDRSQPPPNVPTIAPQRNTDAAQHDAPAMPGVGERLRGPRRAMAQSMASSRDNVMGCTLFDDADLHGWQPEQDTTGRILRAIGEGCAAEPGLNAWFDGESLSRQVLSHVHVAIAVDTAEGLIAPVIRNVRGRSVADLRRDVDRLKRDTHSRTVTSQDLRDFTFMLTNFGMIAGRYATPVVVPPTVAILGCGRLSHDVVAAPTGNIEAHLRMPLSLTFDHRCITGGEAARFLAAVIRDLQKGN
jgi:2-oxoisovalerate dehydrogenase E2 component (dihydrolipoyl transacylase)